MMPRFRFPLLAALIAAATLVTACRTTLVVVPSRDPGYTPRDTLYGSSDGKNVRVTFRHDTTWRVDTVVRVDTAWRGGTRIIQRVDTVRRTDTLRIRGFGAPSRVDTVRIATPMPVPLPGRGGRVDTVFVGAGDTITIVRRDTIRVVQRDTIIRRDTIVRRDTIRVVQRDTLRVPGQRVLFVPPGQYPPAGQCRVWIADRPPGQQARATACDELGIIPEGAFILFGGEAWDADFDWVLEAQRSSVPPEIIAVTRRRRR